MLGALGTAANMLPQIAHSSVLTVRYAMQRVPEDFVYRAKNWAAPYGVKVESNISPSAVRSVEALLSGQADIADSGSAPVLSALTHANGSLTIVAATHSGGQRHELMVKPDAYYKSLADLRGKRIAISVGTGAYIIFELYLAQRGWTNRDFRVVNMAPGDMGAALASGEVDAALTWEPTPSILVTKGAVKVIQSFAEVSSDPALLVARSVFVKEQKDLLVRTLASMVDMYAFIKADPAGAGELAAQTINESGAGVSPSAFARAFENMTFDLSVTQQDIAALQKVGTFMQRANQVAEIPDFAKVIDPEPLTLALALAQKKT